MCVYMHFKIFISNSSLKSLQRVETSSKLGTSSQGVCQEKYP